MTHETDLESRRRAAEGSPQSWLVADAPANDNTEPPFDPLPFHQRALMLIAILAVAAAFFTGVLWALRWLAALSSSLVP